MSLLLTFAFGAGLVSPLNPCGFGLLPAYLGYQLGGEGQRGDRSLAGRLWRGLTAGAAVSAGFAGVLMSAGLLVSLGLRSLVRFLPAAAVVIGLALVVAGVAVLAGRQLSAGGLNRLAARRMQAGNGNSGLVAFGAGYAVASVACTLAILLAVVGQAVATGSLPRMFAVLAAYGAGAATLLTVLSVSATVAGSVLSARLRRVLPFMEPLAGVLLVVSGAYLVVTNVAGLRDTAPVRAVAGLVADASAQASALVQSVYLWFVPVLVVLLLLTALLVLRRSRPGPRQGAGPASPRAQESAVQSADAERADCCGPVGEPTPQPPPPGSQPAGSDRG